MAAIDAALAGFADHVGTAPHCVALMPPILMPMHLAVDGHPFTVRATTGASFFLKQYAPDLQPFIHPDAARDASAQAGALGIGPRVVAWDTAHGAALFEWLAPEAWRMAMREDMENEGTRHAVMAAKRAWHDAPPLGATRSAFDAIRSARETIATLQSEQRGFALPEPFATLTAWIERIEQAIAAAGIDPVPLHVENTLSNIMLGEGGSIRLVDFDHAANGDRLYDVGALCLEYCSFDDEIEAAVELYLGHPDRDALARTKLYMIVDDVRWGCWALIAHWTSPRATAIEFYKYARNRFIRALYRLESWDVDLLMRQA
jgi:thiamine kinase-like enzyme